MNLLDQRARVHGADRMVKVAVPGWDTGVKGLVVTAGMGDLYGEYTLTHESSGCNFTNSHGWPTVGRAAAAAHRIADLANWTLPWQEMHALLTGDRPLANRIAAALACADEDT